MSLRKQLWNDLGVVAKNVNLHWLIVGDFNVLHDEDEKQGGLTKYRSRCPLFQQFFYDVSLKDLEFKGPKFTWSRSLVFEHLDRALCNSLWDMLFPKTIIYHLQKLKSYHRSLVI